MTCGKTLEQRFQEGPTHSFDMEEWKARADAAAEREVGLRETAEALKKRLYHYASGQAWFDELPEMKALEKLLDRAALAQETD